MKEKKRREKSMVSLLRLQSFHLAAACRWDTNLFTATTLTQSFSQLREVRVVLKYRHCDGNLCIKVTDDAVCLQYKTDQAQDVKKIEKLHGKLMRLMVSKESGAMETD
uniref:Signal recognition particle 9 kDa protein n=1 Tax=Esox lucius TaxID=8010 RepID=A0AAY5KTR8_ESOLU